MTSSDPQWTVEFSVCNNRTNARREVRIDAPELADAVAGAVAGIQGVFGSELNRIAHEIDRTLQDFREGASARLIKPVPAPPPHDDDQADPQVPVYSGE